MANKIAFEKFIQMNIHSTVVASSEKISKVFNGVAGKLS